MTGMVGKIKRRRWQESELVRMFEMLADCKTRGVRPGWRNIAAATGHGESSCYLKFHHEKARAEDLLAAAAAARATDRAIVFKPPSPRHVPLQARGDHPPYGQTTSTAKLLMDAELRSRIAVLGITGGLLGDPAPGRSALDKLRRESA